MRAYEVRDKGPDPNDYHTCWVVAASPAQAKQIARQESPKLRGWDFADLRARLAPEFEEGEDMATAHFIDDIDTGLEPHYGYGYSW